MAIETPSKRLETASKKYFYPEKAFIFVQVVNAPAPQFWTAGKRKCGILE
jgi:hypothetical protein